MDYISEYCVSAAMGNVVLAVMYFLKRNYSTRHNRLFLNMILINLAASVLNTVSIHTILHPANFSPFVRLFVNLGYLWFYSLLASMFLLYVDSLTRIPRLKKPIQAVFFIVPALNTVLMVVSNWTGWIAYFDEELVYRRGILHPVLYVTAYGEILCALVLFILSVRKFNRYQIVSVVCFILGNLAAQLFQLLYPRYVISNFINMLSLFFLFTAFENQAYYLYRTTMCFNRHAFISTIRRLQKKETPYQVIALRLNHIQDSAVTAQRSTVDQLITRVAERLYHAFPGKVYALPNDCFTIVREGTDETRSNTALDKVRHCFAEPFTVTVQKSPESVHLLPLVQTLTVTKHFPNGYELLEHLERADCFSRQTLSDEEIDIMLESMRREQQMLHTIDCALEDHDFQMWYQPILDVSTGEYHSAEALIRLKNEQGRFVDPEELIRTAEKHGRISAVGLYVFETVCRMIRDRDLCRLGMDCVEINLSPRQLGDPELADQFLALIRQYGIPAGSVNLEITETAEITQIEKEQMISFVEHMEAEGVTFSLDDYGSGFATIGTLLSYPVQIVKFDKSILWRAMAEPSAMTLLQTSLSAVRGIGRKALVEGVETAEMEAVLRENHVDYLQGYYYAHPLPEEDFIRFIREHR